VLPADHDPPWHERMCEVIAETVRGARLVRIPRPITSSPCADPWSSATSSSGSSGRCSEPWRRSSRSILVGWSPRSGKPACCWVGRVAVRRSS
jgi:hypothetical protein